MTRDELRARCGEINGRIAQVRKDLDTLGPKIEEARQAATDAAATAYLAGETAPPSTEVAALEDRHRAVQRALGMLEAEKAKADAALQKDHWQEVRGEYEAIRGEITDTCQRALASIIAGYRALASVGVPLTELQQVAAYPWIDNEINGLASKIDHSRTQRITALSTKAENHCGDRRITGDERLVKLWSPTHKPTEDEIAAVLRTILSTDLPAR